MQLYYSIVVMSLATVERYVLACACRVTAIALPHIYHVSYYKAHEYTDLAQHACSNVVAQIPLGFHVQTALLPLPIRRAGSLPERTDSPT